MRLVGLWEGGKIRMCMLRWEELNAGEEGRLGVCLRVCVCVFACG